MRMALASAALVGVAITLGGCYYYPPEGYGPPPGGAYGPPPGYNEEGPPPQGEYGPPPQQGAEYGNEAYAPPPPAYSAKWCAKHPHKCRKLQKMQTGAYGPPPSQGQEYGPPPEQGSPPPQR